MSVQKPSTTSDFSIEDVQLISQDQTFDRFIKHLDGLLADYAQSYVMIMSADTHCQPQTPFELLLNTIHD